MNQLACPRVGREFRDRIVASASGLTLLAVVSAVGGCGGGGHHSNGASAGSSQGGAAGGTGTVAITGGATNASVTGGAGGVGASNAAGGAASTAACKATFDPTPELLPTTSFNADAVARAAVVIGSCWPDDGVDRNATHLWASNLSAARTFFRAATQLTCLANAACGCATLEQCLGRKTVTTATSCSVGCNGSSFTACGDAFDLPAGYQVIQDCSIIGQLCNNTVACVEQSAVACDSTYTAGCDADGRPLYCGGAMVQHGPSCSGLGLDCARGLCVGRGAACVNQVLDQQETVQFEGTSCSGGTLTACVNGHLATLNCATLGPGFSCQTVGTQFFCGLAGECAPGNNYSGSTTNPASCIGTVLSYCNAGRLEHIDCTTLGFSGCDINHGIAHYGCI